MTEKEKEVPVESDQRSFYHYCKAVRKRVQRPLLQKDVQNVMDSYIHGLSVDDHIEKYFMKEEK